MTKQFKVIFKCKNVMRVFTEIVEATDSTNAQEIVKKMIVEAGLKLDHITATIQL